MGEEVVAIKALVRQRHLSYAGFCQEWEKIAEGIDKRLSGSHPGHAQFYRWLKGDLRSGKPRTDSCRVLETMFPGWTIDELFAPYRVRASDNHRKLPGQGNRHLDLTGVYMSRPQLLSEVPLDEMIENASLVRASGLSLNLLVQHYPDAQIRRLIESGTRFQLLFLDPGSEAMKVREREEGYDIGFLAGLTEINLRIAKERVRSLLETEKRDRVEIGISNETLRFNITLIDDATGVIQPYLPQARGVDSPTFLVERRAHGGELFHAYEQIFTSLWDRATLL
ncbi:DUF5919 domain-containing protein [Streptomyces sp. CMB-StM0423]|uniref:DUF5919 domain-containing protein n=1 Tax=Streptomyces sp. CMB-StM0423 TaxID=2059884 RepID=UPI000C705A44|nr:DUF5919 domain-containing protein [Streptomyces sp. CMB-StM0423]AUH44871.1 hypothetical protein CXR04_13135 [Streptomyces sp. CMB-StM0423]